MNPNIDLTYCYLDYLPPVPKDLLEDFRQYKSQSRLVGIGDRVTDTSKYERFPISGKLQQWLAFNIVRDPIDFGAGFDNEECLQVNHIPHIDFSRNYSLNYMVTTGGNNVLTNFYQEEGYGLERLDFRSTFKSPQDCMNYIKTAKLTLIDSVQVEHERWVLLNTKVIHEVQNLTGFRSSIQISLSDNNKFLTQ